MNSIKVCEYSRSRSFHDDLILQDQASGERSQDQWSSGYDSETENVYTSRKYIQETAVIIKLVFYYCSKKLK